MSRTPKEPTDAPTKPRVPQVSVLERRLADPESVFVSATIPLKDDPDGKLWKLRWGNYGQDGRYTELVAKGWVQVHVSELLNADAVSGLTDMGDGLVRRGEKGREVLHKMPLATFNQIKMKEARLRIAKTQSKAHMSHTIAEAAAKRYGADAGDDVLKMVGEIRELPTERYDVRELANPDDAA